ncbi:MAG: alcohol dehydrogenase catalytic domain-containing protein [Candidatus Hadarchaeia archaeon]
MLAAAFDGSDLNLEERPKPEISKGEALIRVKAASICQTDLRIISEGHKKLSGEGSTVLGHEFTGEIVELGDEVKGFVEEQDVVIAPNIGCGRCSQCLSGNHHRCPDFRAVGISIDGGFQEYFKAPEEAIVRGNIVPVPDGIEPRVAAVAEPFSTCYNALTACDLGVSDFVLVIGAGPMGILNLIMAKYGGASKVIVSEVLEERQKRAKEFGADAVLDPTESPLEEQVQEITRGEGVDVSIVAAPVSQAQLQAIKSTAIEGKVNFFATLPKDQSLEEFPSNYLHYNQVYVTGTSGASRNHFVDTLDIISSGRVPLDRVVTHEYPLSEMEEALEMARDSESLKVVVKP